MERRLLSPSLVKPIFSLILLLLLAQSSVMELLSTKVEAGKLIPVQQGTVLMMRKMLPTDYKDGCGCYSHDDCRNTPGCGSYCIPGAVVGICREYGPARA